jgi:hypothetical protein
VNQSGMFVSISRINRMNPAPTSKNLQMFKEAYRHYKTYLLIPGTHRPDGSDAKPMIDLGIFKNSVHFRNEFLSGFGLPATMYASHISARIGP